MSEALLVLPAADCSRIRLVRIPEDIGSREAFRTVTGLIAQVEEQNPGYGVDGVRAAPVKHGFTPVEFQLGPALD